MFKDVKDIIEDRIIEIGIPCNLKGYCYIQEAINIVLENNTLSMNEIYKKISVKHNINTSQVTRNIRYSIEFAFNNTYDIAKVYKSFIPNKSGCPTNSQFIKGVARQIERRNYESNKIIIK